MTTCASSAQRFSSPEGYTPRHLAERILLSRAALEGERKQVTILFADLKGSWLLAEIASYPDRFDRERGEAGYRSAMAAAEAQGQRPILADCHLGLGRLYLRIGKRREAGEHFTAATTMYREMDMGFWLGRAEDAMRGLG